MARGQPPPAPGKRSAGRVICALESHTTARIGGHCAADEAPRLAGLCLRFSQHSRWSLPCRELDAAGVASELRVRQHDDRIVRTKAAPSTGRGITAPPNPEVPGTVEATRVAAPTRTTSALRSTPGCARRRPPTAMSGPLARKAGPARWSRGRSRLWSGRPPRTILHDWISLGLPTRAPAPPA